MLLCTYLQRPGGSAPQLLSPALPVQGTPSHSHNPRPKTREGRGVPQVDPGTSSSNALVSPTMTPAPAHASSTAHRFACRKALQTRELLLQHLQLPFSVQSRANLNKLATEQDARTHESGTCARSSGRGASRRAVLAVVTHRRISGGGELFNSRSQQPDVAYFVRGTAGSAATAALGAAAAGTRKLRGLPRAKASITCAQPEPLASYYPRPPRVWRAFATRSLARRKTALASNTPLRVAPNQQRAPALQSTSGRI